MAVVGPEYELLFAYIGINGRNSDGGNCSRSSMERALEENSFD